MSNHCDASYVDPKDKGPSRDIPWACGRDDEHTEHRAFGIMGDVAMRWTDEMSGAAKHWKDRYVHGATEEEIRRVHDQMLSALGLDPEKPDWKGVETTFEQNFDFRRLRAEHRAAALHGSSLHSVGQLRSMAKVCPDGGGHWVSECKDHT